MKKLAYSFGIAVWRGSILIVGLPKLFMAQISVLKADSLSVSDLCFVESYPRGCPVPLVSIRFPRSSVADLRRSVAVPWHPRRRARRDDRSSRRKGDRRSESDDERDDSDKSGSDKERNSDSDSSSRSHRSADESTKTAIVKKKNATTTTTSTMTTPLVPIPPATSPLPAPPTLETQIGNPHQHIFPEAVILASCFGTLLFVLAGAFGYFQRRRLVESAKTCLIRKKGGVPDHLTISSFEPLEHRGSVHSLFYGHQNPRRSWVSLPSFLFPDQQPSDRSHEVLESTDVLPNDSPSLPGRW